MSKQERGSQLTTSTGAKVECCAAYSKAQCSSCLYESTSQLLRHPAYPLTSTAPPCYCRITQQLHSQHSHCTCWPTCACRLLCSALSASCVCCSSCRLDSAWLCAVDAAASCCAVASASVAAAASWLRASSLSACVTDSQEGGGDMCTKQILKAPGRHTIRKHES